MHWNHHIISDFIILIVEENQGLHLMENSTLIQLAVYLVCLVFEGIYLAFSWSF